MYYISFNGIYMSVLNCIFYGIYIFVFHEIHLCIQHILPRSYDIVNIIIITIVVSIVFCRISRQRCDSIFTILQKRTVPVLRHAGDTWDRIYFILSTHVQNCETKIQISNSPGASLKKRRTESCRGPDSYGTSITDVLDCPISKFIALID